MRRRIGLLGIVLGILAMLVGWWVANGPDQFMPAYLGAWLFWGGLAFGALPVVLLLEIGGGAAWAVVPPLRLLVWGIPLAALLLIPVLLQLYAIYPWTHGTHPDAPFGQAWLQPHGFVLRAVAYLVIWTLLALLFAPSRLTPVTPLRRRLALIGLALHLVVGTLAAFDWVMSLTPQYRSTEFGLVVIAAQAAAALAVAVLLAGVAGLAVRREVGLLLLAVAGAWIYVQFVQFLIAWHADLPREAGWYLSRDAGAGRGFEWFGSLAGFALPLLLLAVDWPLRLRAIPIAAGLMVPAHMAETWWLVAPSIHAALIVRATDVLAYLGLGGIAAGLLLMALPRPVTGHA